MTNEELKKKIAEATEQEWFITILVTFPFPMSKQSFNGLSAVYEFVNQQIDGWNQFVNIPEELKQCKTYFENIKNAIVNFVNSSFQLPADALKKQWKSQVENRINDVNQRPLPYNLPLVEFLVRVYQETPDYFQGAYCFLFDTKNNCSVSNQNMRVFT